MPIVKRLFIYVVLLSGVVAFQSDGTTPNRAAVVVRFADDHVESRCVSFQEQQLSGFELLERSDFQIAAQVEGMGVLTCQIEETGCPIDNCLCQCQGGDSCVYWSYWRQAEGGWRYSQLGASAMEVKDGTVDGWSWGPGSLVNAIQPPEVSFDEVCSVAENIPGNEQGVDDANADPIFSYVISGSLIVIMGGALLLLKLKK